MKTGYYWVNLNGRGIIARWDGKLWHHENGTASFAIVMPHNLIEKMRRSIGMKPRPLGGFQCQTGCVCTQNSDGTWTIVC